MALILLFTFPLLRYLAYCSGNTHPPPSFQVTLPDGMESNGIIESDLEDSGVSDSSVQANVTPKSMPHNPLPSTNYSQTFSEDEIESNGIIKSDLEYSGVLDSSVRADSTPKSKPYNSLSSTNHTQSSHEDGMESKNIRLGNYSLADLDSSIAPPPHPSTTPKQPSPPIHIITQDNDSEKVTLECNIPKEKLDSVTNQETDLEDVANELRLAFNPVTTELKQVFAIRAAKQSHLDSQSNTSFIQEIVGDIIGSPSIYTTFGDSDTTDVTSRHTDNAVCGWSMVMNVFIHWQFKNSDIFRIGELSLEWFVRFDIQKRRAEIILKNRNWFAVATCFLRENIAFIEVCFIDFEREKIQSFVCSGTVQCIINSHKASWVTRFDEESKFFMKVESLLTQEADFGSVMWMNTRLMDYIYTNLDLNRRSSNEKQLDELNLVPFSEQLGIDRKSVV